MTTNIIKGSTLVKVTNMTSDYVGYKLDSGVRRRFAPHASMNLPADELRSLSYQPGGNVVLMNFLHVGNKNLAREFGVEDDMVEYDWGEEDIVAALTTSPLDTLLDALEFGPEGISQELVKKAVELEIPDMKRREAIREFTGKNVTAMINNKHAYDAVEEEPKKESKGRRSATSQKKEEVAAEQPKRRRSSTAKAE